MSLRGRLRTMIIPTRYEHRLYPLRQAIGATKGPPACLDEGLLEAVIRDRFDAPLLNVRHVELPGYKEGSAYRVFVQIGPARFRSLILKEVVLTTDRYPAIEGFPGEPGQPEWEVLSATPDPLTAILPEVYIAQEVEAGLHYRYLLEDLSWENRPVLNDLDVETAISALPDVHDRLARWAEAEEKAPDVRHGPESAEAMLAYFEEAFTTFNSWRTAPEVNTILDGWRDVEVIYLDIEHVAQVTERWIHGDFNRKNIFLPVSGRGVKLVDWEWMGSGPPHSDLASVLKRSAWGIQRAAVRRFFAGDLRLSHEEHWKVYLWCRLGRSLLDAALHARQNAAGVGRTAEHVSGHLKQAFGVLAAIKGTATWEPSRQVKKPPAGQAESPANEASRSPRVTVALPVFNGERFLSEVIESLLAQTFTDFELIISDNASTDRTEPISREFAERDARVIYKRHESNVGAHHNYNGLVSLARGEYLKWAADDDLYDPDFLRRCVEALDEHPDVVLAHTQVVDIDPDGEFLADRPFGFDISSDSPVSRFRTYLGAGNACLPIFGLHRTSVLRESGLLGHYPGSDRVLLAELSLHGKFREVPVIAFLHREHAGRSMRRFPDPRERGAWFEPHKSGPDLVYWKVLGGYLSAIRRAPVRPRERAQLLLLIGKWVALTIPDLMKDLLIVGKAKAAALGRRARGFDTVQ